jgi:hypothetical protein
VFTWGGVYRFGTDTAALLWCNAYRKQIICCSVLSVGMPVTLSGPILMTHAHAARLGHTCQTHGPSTLFLHACHVHASVSTCVSTQHVCSTLGCLQGLGVASASRHSSWGLTVQPVNNFKVQPTSWGSQGSQGRQCRRCCQSEHPVQPVQTVQTVQTVQSEQPGQTLKPVQTVQTEQPVNKVQPCSQVLQ